METHSSSHNNIISTNFKPNQTIIATKCGEKENEHYLNVVQTQNFPSGLWSSWFPIEAIVVVHDVSLVKHYLWVYHYNSPMMNSRIQVFTMENEGFFCWYLDSLLTSLIELRGNEMGHAYGELDGPLIRWKGIIRIPLHAWFKGWEMLNAFA